MCDFSAKRLLTATFLCAATAAAAQNGNSNKENDPYSRYGIGEPLTGTNILNRGMGFTSTAYQSPAAVNTDNPASYPSLKLTTYEGGFTGSARTILTDNRSYSTGSASLAYLRVGIPLGKHAGMALGLQPQTHIFYHSVDSSSLEGFGKTASEYAGEGGLNHAFIGGGGQVGGFSFGANFGYMFGTVRNTSRLVNLDSTKVLGTDFSRFTRLGGLYWKAGVQYQAKLTHDRTLRLGATAAISQDISGDRETYSSSFFYNASSSAEVVDTAYTTSGQNGKVTLPGIYSFGAQLSGTKWSVAADATYTDWSSYSNYGIRDSIDGLSAIRASTIRINTGGEYTPDPGSVYHYLQRVTYRLGFYYGTDYVQLRNVDLNYYGMTLGASFPFKRSADRIHTALEIGRRGTQSNGLVQANYLKVHLGISLNDKWFIKRRYD